MIAFLASETASFLVGRWSWVYYSAYGDEYLEALADKLTEAAKSAAVWCIFDNTAEGAATANALDVLGRVRAG